VIERVVPAAAAAAEAFDDEEAGELHPEEERIVAGSVASRRLAFTTARSCARQALAELGLPPAPILRAGGRAPRWPAGVVGSITHCDGYRAAAVARAGAVAALGIDAEPDAPLPGRVLPRIAFGAEVEHLEVLARDRPGLAWDRLLFSAKEAVYKAWWPATGRWLGFEDAAVAIEPDDGAFVADLLVPPPVVRGGPLTRIHGLWVAEHGLVVTCAAVT
jgi:4'-phosphopantetheinyl transferase EntD